MRTFSDDELRNYRDTPLSNMGTLEQELAQTVLSDRGTFRSLRKEIEKMAKQVISPKSNVFTKMLHEIDQRLKTE